MTAKRKKKEDCTELLKKYLDVCDKLHAATQQYENEKEELYQKILAKHDAGELHYDNSKVDTRITFERQRIPWKEKLRELQGSDVVSEIEQSGRESFVRIRVYRVLDGKHEIPPRTDKPVTINRKHLHMVKG